MVLAKFDVIKQWKLKLSKRRKLVWGIIYRIQFDIFAYEQKKKHSRREKSCNLNRRIHVKSAKKSLVFLSKIRKCYHSPFAPSERVFNSQFNYNCVFCGSNTRMKRKCSQRDDKSAENSKWKLCYKIRSWNQFVLE